MTVRELLGRTDSRELAEWMAYSRLEEKRHSRAKGDDPAVKGEQLKADLMAYEARRKVK